MKGADMKRTLLIGLIWFLIFFLWWLNGFLVQNWNFRIFSAQSWIHIWNEFRAGWTISAKSDWIFVLTLLLCVPFFIYVWHIFLKVHWQKSTQTVYRKTKKVLSGNAQPPLKKMKLRARLSHKKVRPQALHTLGRPAMKQGKRTLETASELPAGAAPPPPPPEQAFAPSDRKSSVKPAFLDNPAAPFEDIPLDQIQLPERPRLDEDIPRLLLKAGYQVVRDVQMGDITVDYIALGARRILFCLFDTEAGDWLADEEFFNDEEPLWFSESAHRPSPVHRLLTSAQTFANKLSEQGFSQAVVPVLIEKEGIIINAEDMMKTWKGLSVTVCRTDKGGPEELPAFGRALPPAEDAIAEADFEAIRNLF